MLRTLWIKVGLAAAMLLVILIAGWWQDKRVQSKVAEDEAASQILAVDVDQLERIVIKSKDGTVVLNRRSQDEKGQYTDNFSFMSDEFTLVSDWQVAEPYVALADNSALESVFNTIKTLKSDKLISESKNNAADYGLTDPGTTLTLTVKAQAEPIEVRFGNDNTAGTGVYAMTSNSEKIYLVDRYHANVGQKPTQDWRDKRIMGFKTIGDVKKLSLSYRGGPPLLLKQQDDQWRVQQPEALPGNASEVENILRTVDGLRAQHFVQANVSQLKDYGLDRPWLTLQVYMDPESTTPDRQLFLGRSRTGKIFARRSQFESVWSMDAGVEASLSKTLQDLVSRQAFYLPPAAMDAVHIERGEDVVDLVRREQQWISRNDQQQNTEDPKIFQGMFKITSLKAERYVGKKLTGCNRQAVKMRLMVEQLQAPSDQASEPAADTQPRRESVYIYDCTVKRNDDQFYLGWVEKYGLYYEFSASQIDSIAESIDVFLGRIEPSQTQPMFDEMSSPEDFMPKPDDEHDHDHDHP